MPTLYIQFLDYFVIHIIYIKCNIYYMKITRYIITCKKCIKLIMIIIYWLIINTKGITNIKDIKIVQKRV
ncbi:putative phage protein [Clostridioides difficile]|uniref:Phage protein n=1 Tax=Clostridioides difficile (strain 630) TaxID=272563 RepID=Q18AI0_CLOD6|nr:putative phage protein [Clostridioides difficile 630]CEJ97531.1 putative phage protein [Clostridioides difficile]CEJ99525.1 putative phage protein [Clostridioides difficile]